MTTRRRYLVGETPNTYLGLCPPYSPERGGPLSLLHLLLPLLVLLLLSLYGANSATAAAERERERRDSVCVYIDDTS